MSHDLQHVMKYIEQHVKMHKPCSLHYDQPDHEHDSLKISLHQTTNCQLLNDTHSDEQILTKPSKYM